MFVAAVACVLWAVFARRWRRNNIGINLYLAWMCSASLVLLFIGMYDERYLFLVYPPLAVIVFAVLEHFCRKLFAEERSWYVPAAAALLLFIQGCRMTVPYASGPGEVGRSMVTGAPRRILYAGAATGSFIFAVRAADPNLQTIVLRGDRLNSYTSADFEQLAHDYGIEAVIVAKENNAKPWDQLLSDRAPHLVFEREIPLTSTRRSWNGTISIFRFTNPSPTPKKTLKMYIPKLDSDMEITF